MQKILMRQPDDARRIFATSGKFALAKAGITLVMLSFFMTRGDPPSTTTVWQAISRCLMWAVTIVCVCIGLALFRPQMNRRAKLDAEIALLRAQKDAARANLAMAQQRFDWLKGDPGYLEAYARDMLDLGREGETIFRFQPAP
jgi:hypothetical protein